MGTCGTTETVAKGGKTELFETRAGFERAIRHNFRFSGLNGISSLILTSYDKVNFPLNAFAISEARWHHSKSSSSVACSGMPPILSTFRKYTETNQTGRSSTSSEVISILSEKMNDLNGSEKKYSHRQVNLSIWLTKSNCAPCYVMDREVYLRQFILGGMMYLGS